MQRAADGARGRARTRNPVQEYKCPACGARYNTLQALSLIDPSDGLFHCEACRAVLVDEEPGGGGGGEGARGARLAEAKALQVCGVEKNPANPAEPTPAALQVCGGNENPAGHAGPTPVALQACHAMREAEPKQFAELAGQHVKPCCKGYVACIGVRKGYVAMLSST